MPGGSSSALSSFTSNGSVNSHSSKKRRNGRGEMERAKTPWHPMGVPPSMSLADELNAFAELVAMNGKERGAREALLQSIVSVVQRIMPKSEVMTVGSFAYGISTPTSGVDVLVENAGGDPLTEGVLSSLSVLGALEVPAKTEEGRDTVRVMAPNGIAATLIFVQNTDSEEKLKIAAAKNWQAEFPAASVVVAVVRHVLAQACADLINSRKGGITPFALLVMIIQICRMCLVPTDAGEVLLAFFEGFGKEINLKELSISGDTAAPLPKVHDGEISVVSVSGGNLTGSCTRLRQIRAHILSCHIALRQFDPRRDSHTALSTIISHQPLWQRSEGGSERAQQTELGGFKVGDRVETLRSDGSWMGCSVTAVDVSRDRVSVQGAKFIKKVPPNKLRFPQAAPVVVPVAYIPCMVPQQPQVVGIPLTPNPAAAQPIPISLLHSAKSTSGKSLWSVEDVTSYEGRPCSPGHSDDGDLDIAALTSNLRLVLGQE